MHHRYQCFCLDEIITRFNYVLRINQIFALFDQILNFTLKHRANIQWICSYIDIPMGLHLIMIDLHGQISIDERLYEKLVLTTSQDSKRLIDANGIVQWLIRLMRRMSTRCFNEFESIEIYLNEINKNQSDRRVIEQIIKKCRDDVLRNLLDPFNPSVMKIDHWDQQSISRYNQVIIQILCRDLNSKQRIFFSNRKRIQPIQSDDDDDDDDRRRNNDGKKRVDVIECLLESSSPEENLCDDNSSGRNLMKNDSDTLSLSFAEFCHIRNVITRAELETLMFDEKLYNEVAQSKLCFTCRKVYFNILTLTFGVQCNVCKQKVCRNCLTQIALPKTKFQDLPIHAVTPLTSVETQTPLTPVMNDLFHNENTIEENEIRRCSTPAHLFQTKDSNQWPTELINICTDCFFLLQQIRKKSRKRHIKSHLVSSNSSSSTFNRIRQSNSNQNIPSSSSSSSIAALLAKQRNFMIRTTSLHSNLKQTRSVQDLSFINDKLASTNITAAPNIERIRPSRHQLFLKLQPAYDPKVNHVKTG